MKVIHGQIEDIREVERFFHGAWGVSCIHDGSRRYSRFGCDGIESALYVKKFLVHVEEGVPLLTEKAIVQFHYNHRDGKARVEIPSDRWKKLLHRMPELQGLLCILGWNDGNLGEPLVRVKEMNLRRAVLAFHCPRCQETFTHTCQSGKEAKDVS